MKKSFLLIMLALCTADKGEISVDVYNKFFLILPEKNEAFNQTDLNIDREEELKKVENEPDA